MKLSGEGPYLAFLEVISYFNSLTTFNKYRWKNPDSIFFGIQIIVLPNYWKQHIQGIIITLIPLC